MNTTLNRVAPALTGALFAGTTLAGGGNDPANDARASIKSRAEMQAESKACTLLIRGDAHPLQDSAASQRTPEEVRAEAARARPIRSNA